MSYANWASKENYRLVNIVRFIYYLRIVMLSRSTNSSIILFKEREECSVFFLIAVSIVSVLMKYTKILLQMEWTCRYGT